MLFRSGEVHLARGKNAEAAEFFMAAIIPASEGTAPPLPVLTNVVLNLARLRQSERKWVDAEDYFQELQKLASLQRNPQLKVFAIEQLAQTQYEQGKVSDALESWHAGASVAEKLELPLQRQGILERLLGHYVRVGDSIKSRHVEQQLAAVGQSIRSET